MFASLPKPQLTSAPLYWFIFHASFCFMLSYLLLALYYILQEYIDEYNFFLNVFQQSFVDLDVLHSVLLHVSFILLCSVRCTRVSFVLYRFLLSNNIFYRIVSLTKCYYHYNWIRLLIVYSHCFSSFIVPSYMCFCLAYFVYFVSAFPITQYRFYVSFLHQFPRTTSVWPWYHEQ